MIKFLKRLFGFGASAPAQPSTPHELKPPPQFESCDYSSSYHPHNSAYRKGKAAKEAGMSLSQNPFAYYPETRAAWIAGWNAGIVPARITPSSSARAVPAPKPRPTTTRQTRRRREDDTLPVSDPSWPSSAAPSWPSGSSEPEERPSRLESGGGSYGGAGASASWDEPASKSSPSYDPPSSSYDSGSSGSSYSSSSDSGSYSSSDSGSSSSDSGCSSSD